MLAPVSQRNRSGRRLGVLAVLCALAASGCASCHFCCLPRIDPTGDHIFVHNNSGPPPALPAAVESPPAVVVGPLAPPPTSAPVIMPPLPPAAAPAAAPIAAGGPLLVPQLGVSLSPTQVVAPVGSEVIMIATVVNQAGGTLPRERVEWTIAQGGVGQFGSPGQRGAFDFLDALRGLPKKVNNTYVVNSTVSHATTIDRGTPTPTDDVAIRSGQAWVTVTSPVEGSSFVTAYAPDVKGWDQRQQTGSIYWIDSQWMFPPPTINPAGTRHSFTTSVTRQTDGSPLAGWIVRYEITGGPDAGFSPDGGPILEVMTSESGQATAEIFQKAATAGSNQISIQVIHPSGATGPGRRVVVGSGSTTATWISSDITLRTSGPAQAGVGAVATYRIEVTNPASVPVQGVVVVDQAPAGLVFLNSNPAPISSPGGQQWQLGDLGPRQTQVIEANFRVEQAGSLSYCASVTTSSGTSTKSCATTQVGAGQLDVAIRGPAAAEVGTDATFTIEVTNRGDTPATTVVISDRFDAGLQHTAAASPIEANVAQIAARETRRITVTFHVAQAGQLCQEVTVTADGNLRGEGRTCITAADRAGLAVPPAAGPTPAAPPSNPTPAVPPAAAAPQTIPRTPGGSRLTVHMTGPDHRKLGESAQFVSTVTNVGDAPLNNVLVSDVAETSLEVTGAEVGFEIRGGALTWTVPTLEPGQSKSFRVDCRCVKESTRACNRVNVTADGGTTGGDEACVEITAPAAAAAATPATASKMSIAVADQADPIRAGGETTYQIVLSNNGAGRAKQVALSVTVSPEMTITEVHTSPVRGTMFPRSVKFTPIAEIRPGESITFELRVRGDRAGTGRLHAEVTSDQDRSPIVADETTQILD